MFGDIVDNILTKRVCLCIIDVMIVKDLFGNNESYTHECWRFRNISVGFSRLYYIIDGEAYYEENGKAVRLKKGHLYLTPIKKPFSLYENDKDKLLHTYTHIYTLPAVTHFTEIEVREGTPLWDAVVLWRKYINTEDKELLINVIQFLLACVDRQIGQESAAARLTKAYIDGLENYTLDMDALSHAVGYTREHVTRSFMAAYRMTPKQYLNSRRMELALRSLSDGCSVKETAEQFGYATPYSFSKAFKHHYGLSPENYLKSLHPSEIKE